MFFFYVSKRNSFPVLRLPLCWLFIRHSSEADDTFLIADKELLEQSLPSRRHGASSVFAVRLRVKGRDASNTILKVKKKKMWATFAKKNSKEEWRVSRAASSSSSSCVVTPTHPIIPLEPVVMSHLLRGSLQGGETVRSSQSCCLHLATSLPAKKETTTIINKFYKVCGKNRISTVAAADQALQLKKSRQSNTFSLLLVWLVIMTD